MCLSQRHHIFDGCPFPDKTISSNCSRYYYSDVTENKKVTYACLSQTSLLQTWECIDINNGISSRDVFYDDVNAKQVKAECLLKSDCQAPKLLSIRLK